MVEAAVLTSLGWLASPLLKMLFDKAHHYLGTGIDERRKILAAIVLPRLSLAIEKAEKSRNKDKLEVWLRRLKDAYYEAEEAIDLFEYELLKQKVNDDRKTLEQKEKNERGTRISLPSQFVPRCLDITSIKLKCGLSVFSWKRIMLKRCIDKLIEIAKEANEFRDLLEDQENASNSDVDRDTISEPPARIFGREIDKKTIVSLLMEKPLNSEPGPNTRQAIPIIAITGRSGVGKTALAQHVYKHMDGQEQFDLCLWVHTPRKFNAADVIKTMIEIIKAIECSHNYNPPTSLEALLTQIRHICLPGSRIIITTQSKNVAQKVSLVGVTEIETYYLQDIDEDQFLELFMHYAWPSNSHLQKEKFEEIGRKIVIKLKGDPGAAKLVGHELSGKLDLRHWEEVSEKDWLGDNMKARIWSYQQLPLDLQRCFAICSLYPIVSKFSGDYLIDLWMAEGFIRPIHNQERLEDIGQNYLNELISRFFLDPVVYNKEIRYQLHDLLYELAEQVQGDDFFRIDSTNSGEIPFHISNMLSRIENIRHIHLPSSIVNKLKKETLCLMKKIRTFIVQNDDYMGNLKHLRSLNIYGLQPSKKLPDSICKLYNLQTFVLPYCESLPKVSDLISLRRLTTFEERIPRISEVGRLTSLQRLHQFIARKERGYELHQLENLNQLRGRMRITGLENVGSTADAVKANLGNKKHLQELEFEWTSDESNTNNVACLSTQHVELLEALHPHPKISALTLKGFGGDRFPNWFLSQNSLKHLRSLILMDCSKVDEISSIHESLPSCTTLILQGFKNLKKIPTFPPNLSSLEISNRPQLSYFSGNDLLEKEERNQSKHEVVKQIVECLKQEDVLLPRNFESNVKLFFLSVKHRLEAAFDDSPDPVLDEWAEILTFDPLNKDYSRDQLLDGWVMFMHYHIEKMFKKNEESKLTITSLPPKEVLCLLKNLQSLTIKGCYLLSSLGGIGALTSLIVLELDGCLNLITSNEPLPSSLERLKFSDCPNVDVIIAESNLPVLCSLEIWYIMFKKLRGVLRVGHLPSLKELTVVGLDGRLEGLNSLTALHTLRVRHSPEMKLSPMDKYTSVLKEVAVDNLLLLKLILSNEIISALEAFVIYYIDEYSLDEEVFQSLISLTDLSIYDYNRIFVSWKLIKDCSTLTEKLIEEQPKNLRELEIKDCSTLTEKSKKGGPNYQVWFNEGSTFVTFPTEGTPPETSKTSEVAESSVTTALLEKLTHLVSLQQSQILALQQPSIPQTSSMAIEGPVHPNPIDVKFDRTNYGLWSQSVELYVKVATTFYDGNDAAQVVALNRRVSRIKQMGKTVEEYYNELQELWQEIDFRRPNPMVYPEEIEKFSKFVEEMSVYMFLDGLEDKFDRVRADVVHMTPFPTVAQAYA
ncbi:putative disease resistance RPP13-like protein 1 [Carex rostrata]